MNRTRIEWTDHTLNPVVGCLHNCPYCYARGQAKRSKQRCRLCYTFVPYPHLERLIDLNPTQKPKRIFIDSMWDWNSHGVQTEWLKTTLKKIRECPQHTFQILSKKPKDYDRLEYPPNVWLGTSIATTADCFRIHDISNPRVNNLKFVSIEPIHEKIDFWFTKDLIGWMIVGAETGRRKGKIRHKAEWIYPLIENARTEEIPLFLKDNVQWNEIFREFPN